MKHPLFIVFLLITLLLSGCRTTPAPEEPVSPPESEALLETEPIFPRQIPIEVTYLDPSFGLGTEKDPIEVLGESGFDRFPDPNGAALDCRARIFRTAEELFSSPYTELLHVIIYDAEGQHRYVPFLEEYPKTDWNRYFETHDLIMVYDTGTGITPEIQTLTQDPEKNQCELLLHTYYSEGLMSMEERKYLMLVEVEKGVFETADGKTLSLIVREEWLPMSAREEKP